MVRRKLVTYKCAQILPQLLHLSIIFYLQLSFSFHFSHSNVILFLYFKSRKSVNNFSAFNRVNYFLIKLFKHLFLSTSFLIEYLFISKLSDLIISFTTNNPPKCCYHSCALSFFKEYV